MTSVPKTLDTSPAYPPLVLETPAMEASVTALIDRVFGPGRFAKPSERLREGNTLLAAEADERGAGLGQALVESACEAARAAGWRAVLLVGDGPYFGRIGFANAHTADVTMPGPVDQRRVLLLPLREGGDEGLSGPVAIAPGARA